MITEVGSAVGMCSCATCRPVSAWFPGGNQSCSRLHASVKFGLNVDLFLLKMEISMCAQEGNNAILFPQSVFPKT